MFIPFGPEMGSICYFTDEETEAQRGYSFAQVTRLEGELTGAWTSDLTSEASSCPLLSTGLFGGSSYHCYELEEVPGQVGFPDSASGKEHTYQCRRRKRHRSGRSPGGGHGNPPQDSCLENPMDRGAWRATVHSGSQRVRHNWSDLAGTCALGWYSLQKPTIFNLH